MSVFSKILNKVFWFDFLLYIICIEKMMENKNKIYGSKKTFFVKPRTVNENLIFKLDGRHTFHSLYVKYHH